MMIHKHLTSRIPLLPVLLAGLLSAACNAETISLEQVSGGTFYVPAHVDALVETTMLLDTGSGYVSLTPDTFARVKEGSTTRFLRHIAGVMANGKRVRVPVYSIGELRLGNACILRDIEVVVMDGADRDILGLSALRQIQPFTLQLDPPQLEATCAAS